MAWRRCRGWNLFHASIHNKCRPPPGFAPPPERSVVTNSANRRFDSHALRREPIGALPLIIVCPIFLSVQTAGFCQSLSDGKLPFPSTPVRLAKQRCCPFCIAFYFSANQVAQRENDRVGDLILNGRPARGALHQLGLVHESQMRADG